MADRAVPLQNRVTPEGVIVATPHRGLLMGNRGGAFHRPDQTLGRSRWASRQWIACVLSFKGRHRAVMQPNRYTELFFLDEATALAAGHRPCFECRRADALRFASLWASAKAAGRNPRAPEMDMVLHAERVAADGRKVTHTADSASLPDGAFVALRIGAAAPVPHLVTGRRLLAWSPAGYGAALERPNRGQLTVLTPRTIVAVLAAGYQPMLHPTAGAET